LASIAIEGIDLVGFSVARIERSEIRGTAVPGFRCAQSGLRTEHTLSFSRQLFCPSFAIIVRPSSEGAGNAGCPMHRGSGKKCPGSATGSPVSRRHSLCNGFTTYSVLSPLTGLLPPSLASSCRKLDASVGASGPHGFTDAAPPFVRTLSRATTLPGPDRQIRDWVWGKYDQNFKLFE
jgi:hypothetical protein